MDDPSDEEISDVLGALSPERWYASLERREGWFVQVGVGTMADAPPGCFVLELREGEDATHRRTVVRALSDVIDAFRGYARGDASWTGRFSWGPAF